MGRVRDLHMEGKRVLDGRNFLLDGHGVGYCS